MSLKDQLREEVRAESQKLKDMSFQDKIWYIWEYYKIHIGGVVLAFLLISVVVTSVRNISIHPGLYCVVLNNLSSQDMDTSILEQDFHDHMGFGEKQPVYVESMYITYGDNATELSYASMAKISALVASKDLDIIISDQESADHYAALDGLADLEKLLPADILSAVEDRLFFSLDGQGRPTASSLDLKGTALAGSMRLSEDASYLSVISNSDETETVFALIRYIFGL